MEFNENFPAYADMTCEEKLAEALLCLDFFYGGYQNLLPFMWEQDPETAEVMSVAINGAYGNTDGIVVKSEADRLAMKHGDLPIE